MTKTMNYTAAVGTIAALVLSSFAAVTPALAWGGNNGGDVEIDNEVKISVANFAVVHNVTTSSASTGGNYAGGAYGGNGAEGGEGDEGGNADADADAEEGDAEAGAQGGNGGNGGKGGNGGDAGVGGTITTGDAEANSGVMNVVNSTDLEVEGCGCDGNVNYDENEVDDIEVDNEVKLELVNGGIVSNFTDAYAKTGWNVAAGVEGGNAGEGGNGDEGGNADADADSDAHHDDMSDADAWAQGGEGGNGGRGGRGGVALEGGVVVTGNATSNSGAVNVINSTLLRVRR
jgi:hypothetical protein